METERGQHLAALREQLRQAQARQGLTKTQLARRTGLGRTTISQAFSDNQRPPSQATVAALAKALALDAGPLLLLLREDSADPPPAPPPDPPAEPGRPTGEPHHRRSRVPGLRWPPRRLRRPRAVTALAAAVVVLAVMALIDPFGWWSRGSGNEGGGGSPSAGPAAVLGDVREADPCSLLDAKALARFGATTMDTDYGEFDRCDVLVHQGDDGDVVADVNLNFASDPMDPDARARRKRVRGVTVAEVPGDEDECVRNLQLADGNQIWIVVEETDSPAPDLCALARAATDHAVKVLARGPVPRRPAPFPANSLARQHACELLDPAALSVLPGFDVRDRDPGFADWECDWPGDGGAGVSLEFSQDNEVTGWGHRRTESGEGRPTRLDGRRGYVAPGDGGDHTCVVGTEHRAYTDAAGEPTVELLLLTVDGPQPEEELCETAEALATAVAKRLPKP